jgi:trimeric autotransporter adhesin
MHPEWRAAREFGRWQLVFVSQQATRPYLRCVCSLRVSAQHREKARPYFHIALVSGAGEHAKKGAQTPAMSAALAVDTGEDAVSTARSLSSVCSSRAGKSRFGFKAESVTPAASACTSPMLSPAPAAEASDVGDEDAPSSPRILRRRGNALPKPPPRAARSGISVPVKRAEGKRSNNTSDDESIQARIPLGVKRIRSSESVHTTDSERANRGAVPRKALAVKLPTRVTVAAAAAAAAHASSDASGSTAPPSPRMNRRDVNAGAERGAPRSASKQNLHAAASAVSAGPSGYARTARSAVGRGGSSNNTPRKQLRQSLQDSRIRALAEMMFKLDDSGKHTHCCLYILLAAVYCVCAVSGCCSSTHSTTTTFMSVSNSTRQYCSSCDTVLTHSTAANSVRARSQRTEVEELLREKIKGNKWDYKAKMDKQEDLILRLRTKLSAVADQRKLFISSAADLECTLHNETAAADERVNIIEQEHMETVQEARHLSARVQLLAAEGAAAESARAAAAAGAAASAVQLAEAQRALAEAVAHTADLEARAAAAEASARSSQAAAAAARDQLARAESAAAAQSAALTAQLNSSAAALRDEVVALTAALAARDSELQAAQQQAAAAERAAALAAEDLARAAVRETAADADRQRANESLQRLEADVERARSDAAAARTALEQRNREVSGTLSSFAEGQKAADRRESELREAAKALQDRAAAADAERIR